ncbi:uncharacterized protein LOC106477550, partial [Limulus polyphemus]|uniref:Uncharacterized protein LOC106477550 n=1 Tax=Limulus polyphemus TaxID=6850 RepID=A0ABM1C3L1_LIMPO
TQRARRAKKDDYFLTLDYGCEFDTLLTTDEMSSDIPCSSIKEDIPALSLIAREIEDSTACHNSDSRNKRSSKSHATEDNHGGESSIRKKDFKTTVRRRGSSKTWEQGNGFISTREYSSRPSSPVKPSQERYLSWETLSDRRSSSESTKDTSKKLTVRDISPVDDSHHGSYSDFLQQQEIYSSPSESSLEERFHQEEKERRRKERMKRRSKVHRQKSYVEDPSSDPTFYFQKSKRRSSLESSSATESFEKDLNYVSKRRHNLKVPHAAEKPLRQIASESELKVRKSSCESSDASDNSVNVNTYGDQSLYCGAPESYHSGERLAVKHKSIRSSDARFSPTGTGDSSMSPDEHSHCSTDKSCSVDEGDSFTRSRIRRSIPSVLVDSVVDHQRSASVSLLTSGHYIVDTPFPRRSSVKPQLPVPENQLGLYPCSQGKTRSTHSLDLPREETGWTERRASAPEGENIQIVIDDVDSDLS